MPVYIHLANLIASKQSLSSYYNGGLEQFRSDYNSVKFKTLQEDNDLISIGALNTDEFDIEKLVDNGLRFDGKTSPDFVIMTRYGGPLWQVDWLDENKTFVWHVDCNPGFIAKAKYIGEKMTMNEVGELADKGINVFETIK